jgi:hypothetical protein
MKVGADQCVCPQAEPHDVRTDGYVATQYFVLNDYKSLILSIAIFMQLKQKLKR